MLYHITAKLNNHQASSPTNVPTNEPTLKETISPTKVPSIQSTPIGIDPTQNPKTSTWTNVSATAQPTSLGEGGIGRIATTSMTTSKNGAPHLYDDKGIDRNILFIIIGVMGCCIIALLLFICMNRMRRKQRKRNDSHMTYSTSNGSTYSWFCWFCQWRS